MFDKIKHYILLRFTETTTWSALIGLIGFFVGLYYKQETHLIWEATGTIIGFLHAFLPNNLTITALNNAIQKQAGKINDNSASQ